MTESRSHWVSRDRAGRRGCCAGRFGCAYDGGVVCLAGLASPARSRTSAGSSEWFDQLLSRDSSGRNRDAAVPPETIAVHGTVSEPTAQAMAIGALAQKPRARRGCGHQASRGPGGGCRSKRSAPFASPGTRATGSAGRDATWPGTAPRSARRPSRSRSRVDRARQTWRSGIGWRRKHRRKGACRGRGSLHFED